MEHPQQNIMINTLSLDPVIDLMHQLNNAALPAHACPKEDWIYRVVDAFSPVTDINDHSTEDPETGKMVVNWETYNRAVYNEVKAHAILQLNTSLEGGWKAFDQPILEP